MIHWTFELSEDGWNGVWRCTQCNGYLPDSKMDSELRLTCPYCGQRNGNDT